MATVKNTLIVKANSLKDSVIKSFSESFNKETSLEMAENLGDIFEGDFTSSFYVTPTINAEFIIISTHLGSCFYRVEIGHS